MKWQIQIFLLSVCLLLSACDDFTSNSPQTNDTPPPPVLLYPENGAVNVELSPVFRWQNGGALCTIEISVNPEFSPVMWTSGSFSDSLRFSDSLSCCYKYYWRAKANYGIFGESGWSNAFWFQTHD